jgi:hypothetical protein
MAPADPGRSKYGEKEINPEVSVWPYMVQKVVPVIASHRFTVSGASRPAAIFRLVRS